MNYAQIFDCDCGNGPGMREILFVSGCRHRCEGCFNEQAWDFSFGEPFTKDVEEQLLKKLSPSYIAGLTLLGGEPMEIENQRGLLPFAKRVREQFPNKTIWLFSGFLFEELTGQKPSRCRCEVTDELLGACDVLVDGPFILAQKDISLKFRGSTNQRVLDLKRSLAAKTPVWLAGYSEP
ncbi:MAG: anaerobic ribonucleoside-triphosphate reductase activating protein [Oscillibacter sp.]|jgi:anaerobic ribonucleoside-triphosphate reductase activating protein|nr:anaerobic ribonucleoside-triphosphate reductase activating protein [Oscillibacter sp.]